MSSTRLFFALLAITLTAYGLKVEDIFPEDLIRKAELSVRHEDFGINIVQFLKKYGYPIESHQVKTEDGYLLTMHRIPHGRNESDSSTKKPAVLLMHGLLSSSMDWVNMGPDVSLALMLADGGYDVWLGNNRGNTWSRKHVSLDPDEDKEEFWDFSFDDCGYYDLPAKIDYILKITRSEKVAYVGHSQGTSQFFAMASLRPEYNDKIAVMSALAPVAYMQNMSQPLVRLASNYTVIVELVFNELGIHEFFPSSPLLVEVIEILCNDDSPLQELCADFLFFLVGYDPDQLNKSFIEVIGSNAPAGSSIKMVLHYLQEINSGHFRRYDYGLKNLEVYKSLNPPNYDASLITAPVALFYAENDLMAAVCNVEQLADELPNVVEQNLIEPELFNHLDFIWAIDVRSLVNDKVVAVLNKYHPL